MKRPSNWVLMLCGFPVRIASPMNKSVPVSSGGVLPGEASGCICQFFSCDSCTEPARYGTFRGTLMISTRSFRRANKPSMLGQMAARIEKQIRQGLWTRSCMQHLQTVLLAVYNLRPERSTCIAMQELHGAANSAHGARGDEESPARQLPPAMPETCMHAECVAGTFATEKSNKTPRPFKCPKLVGLRSRWAMQRSPHCPMATATSNATCVPSW